jgi:hypothetical protein
MEKFAEFPDCEEVRKEKRTKRKMVSGEGEGVVGVLELIGAVCLGESVVEEVVFRRCSE